jgi:hypothetical protein
VPSDHSLLLFHGFPVKQCDSNTKRLESEHDCFDIYVAEAECNRKS